MEVPIVIQISIVIIAVSLSTYLIALAWDKCQESKAWVSDDDEKEEDDGDWWKKNRNE